MYDELLERCGRRSTSDKEWQMVVACIVVLMRVSHYRTARMYLVQLYVALLHIDILSFVRAETSEQLGEVLVPEHSGRTERRISKCHS